MPRRLPAAPVAAPLSCRLLLAATALFAATACQAADAESGAAPEPRVVQLRADEDPRWWRREGAAFIERQKAANSRKRAKNIILFVGDGMGVSTVTAARILEGQLRGEPGEENYLSFERFPYSALSKTWNTNQQTPDSAGTATAMVTGVKTRAGFIGVDGTAIRGDCAGSLTRTLPTLLEQAEDMGKATGVVTTATLTHATPAANWAKVPERGWEVDARMPEAARAAGCRDIARQLIEFDHGDGIDVAFGGGRQMFLPATATDPEDTERPGLRLDGRDLTAEWVDRNPGNTYVWNKEQFDALKAHKAGQVLGLFERSHLEWESDRETDEAGEPSLAQMTKTAIALLKRNRSGFFLMVEAGRIDHAHHMANAYRALHDTIELHEAVAMAREMTRDRDTLIIVTADHSHVFNMAGYPARGNPILGLVRSTDGQGLPDPELATDGLGLPYTTLGYQNGPGYTGASDGQPAGPKTFPHLTRTFEPGTGRPDLTEVDTTHPDYLQEVAVPASSETHAGEDVAIYATGPGAHLVRGVMEQSFIYWVMAEAFGL